MTLRLCREVLNFRVETLEDVPDDVLAFLDVLKYEDIIRPLVDIDRARGLTYGQLCNAFGVTAGYIEYHFRNKTQIQ